MSDTTNAAEVVRDLNAALPLQYRCALAFAIAAGTMPGIEGLAIGERLSRWAAEELVHAERIAGRVATLGGEPAMRVAALEVPTTAKAGIRWLTRIQREALDAIVAAIPADADDAEGEATEHLLEHLIERKRNVLEVLERASR